MLWRNRFLMVLAVGMLMGPLLRSADEGITIGLIPDGLSAEDRAPLRDYLAKTLGRPVKLAVPDRYAETVSHLEDGSYDFALLGALSYVRSHAKQGVVPLVQRSSDRQFHSVFIANEASGIQSLRDLKGKRFAFGDVSSTSGHLIPYMELKEAGINADTDLKALFSGAHPVTAAMVENGAVDAGAMDESVYNSLISSGKISRKVSVFYTSKPFVDYVFVSRKAVSETEREKFAKALLDLKEGQDDGVLKALRAKKFVPANDQEYEIVRRLAKELNLF